MLKHKLVIFMASAISAAVLVYGSAAWSQSNPAGSSAGKEELLTVNFKDTDIEEVIKFVAEETGKTMVLDPRVKGRVKVISRKPVNSAGLYELFLNILELYDYAAVEVGNVVRIVPVKDARSSPIPVDAVNEEGYVTEVYQLKNVDAAKILPVLRPLIPQTSHMAADTFSNSLVVTDSVDNIRRLIKIIERLDLNAMPETEVITLKYADAEDLVATLTKLGQQEAKQAPSSNKLQIIADKRNNAILLSGEDAQRQRAKDLIRRLDRPQMQSGNVRVIYLSYANAKDVAAVLSKVVQNMQKSAPGGKDPRSKEQGVTVEADEDTNALLLTGSGDTLNSLMSVIEKLDIRRAQVLIEAIIVKVNVTNTKALGLDYLGFNAETGVAGSNIGNQGGKLGALGSAALDGNNAGVGAALIGAPNPSSGLSLALLGGKDDSPSFGALLTALQTDNNANILSTPSVLTMDNSEASISVGKEISISTGSYASTGGGGGGIQSPFSTNARESVGVLLTVTPQVNEGNQILLTVAQEVSSLDGTDASGQPILDESKINTEILASDGQILVLGGLIDDQVSETVNKVPILGSIPILGHLFRSNSTIVSKQNLMVFLRARIIREDSVLNAATIEKYQYIRDKQLDHRDRGLDIMLDRHIPVLPAVTIEDLYNQSEISTEGSDN